MKKIGILAAVIIIISVAQVFSEDKGSRNALQSQTIDNEGKNLDNQIDGYNKKIREIMEKNDLLNNKGIKVLPYRFNYEVGKDYIKLERYVFVKDEIYERSIVGVRTKSLKIYTSGKNISRIEYTIYENNHLNEEVTEVFVDDPSPDAVGTDDMLFTHKKNNRILIKGKRLADVKNTTAFPLRNEIKREFIVPTLAFFYNSLLFICESYGKSLKDSDSELNEFLKMPRKF